MLKHYGTPEYLRIRDQLLGMYMGLSDLTKYTKNSHDSTEVIAEELRIKFLAQCCNNSNDDECYGRC